MCYLSGFNKRGRSNHSLTFKQRPSTYCISKAPTNRARCRACKGLVEKGQLRITITAFVRPGRSTQLVRCAKCIDERFAAVVLAVYGTAARVPVDVDVDAADAVVVRQDLERVRSGLS